MTRDELEADPCREKFEAVMKMKNEPLILSESEAEAYEALKRRRAKPVAKPLPVEADHA